MQQDKSLIQPETSNVVSMEQAASTRAARQRDEETQLLMRIRDEGEQRAFDELFRTFAPKLVSYLSGLGCELDLAESLMQDAMIAVWTKAKLFDADKASARTWIYTLVRNRFIDHKRANKRRASAYERYGESREIFDDPIDHNQRQADNTQVANLLKQLPAEQTQILLLAYVEGKSHREIATQLNIPLGTTKSRVRLAFQRLRKLMEEVE